MSAKPPVLILDSDRDAADRCRSELRAAGLDAELVADVEGALARLSVAPVSALVVQLDAREVDGLGVVSAVRAHASTAGLPIVAMTAGYDDAIHELARQHGCDGLSVGENSTVSVVGLVTDLLSRPRPRAA